MDSFSIDLTFPGYSVYLSRIKNTTNRRKHNDYLTWIRSTDYRFRPGTDHNVAPYALLKGKTMHDPENLSRQLAEQNQWALDNPEAWLSILLDVETADEFQPQAI